MKNIKRIIVSALLALSALGMVACGGESITTSNKITADAAWYSLSSYDQAQACDAFDVLSPEAAAEAFASGAGMGVDEARTITDYLDDTYC